MSNTDWQYAPGVFEPSSVDMARKVILTNEGSLSDVRWKEETPVLFNMLAQSLQLISGMMILDFGCGIGRLSKLFAEKGVYVIGVDISKNMRKMAVDYVENDDYFAVISPSMLDRMVGAGMKFDAAFAVWVLQHCPDTDAEVDRIANALRVGGRFHVINNRILRAIPVHSGNSFKWHQDEKSIWDSLNRKFTEVPGPELPPTLGNVDMKKFLSKLYMRNLS